MSVLQQNPQVGHRVTRRHFILDGSQQLHTFHQTSAPRIDYLPAPSKPLLRTHDDDHVPQLPQHQQQQQQLEAIGRAPPQLELSFRGSCGGGVGGGVSK
jgi:hypothetical protein